MEKKLDLRIEKTYLALHNAFTALLNEKRFEEFTVGDLCDRAMIRRTTFYKHFADKYEYFTFYLKEHCEAFQRQIASNEKADDLNTYFILMARQLIHFIENNRELVLNLANSNMFSVLFDILFDLMVNDLIVKLQEICTEQPMTSAEIESIASFYSGGLLYALRRMLMHGAVIDEEQFIWVVSRFPLRQTQ